jgi:HAD superfamily hydrolase (TIGR01549 family)
MIAKWIFGFSAAFITISLAIFWYKMAHQTTFRGKWNQIKSPLIIFDFDGTICPSYPLFLDQMAVLLGMRRKGDEDFKNMTPRQILKAYEISLFRLPFLLRKARRNVQEQLLELAPVPGIIEVLRELKKRGYSLGILTSNSEENVQRYFQKHNIDVFDFIYTGNNIFGKEKHLKAILKKAHLDPKRELVVYVGDEVRDIEASQKAGVQSVGVSWGYNSFSLLQMSAPDFLLENPLTLLRVFHDQSFFSPHSHKP